jgi:hypothetical protein
LLGGSLPPESAAGSIDLDGAINRVRTLLDALARQVPAR